MFTSVLWQVLGWPKTSSPCQTWHSACKHRLLVYCCMPNLGPIGKGVGTAVPKSGKFCQNCGILVGMFSPCPLPLSSPNTVWTLSNIRSHPEMVDNVACDRYVCFQASVTNIHWPDQSTTGWYCNTVYKMKVEAKLCRILQLTLTYQKFLLCISS